MTSPALTAPSTARLTGLHLTGTTEAGPLLVAGVGLEADPGGLSVLDGTLRRARTWAWDEIDGLSADRTAVGPDGRDRQLLEVTVAGRTHGFMVPVAELSVFLAALETADWLWPSQLDPLLPGASPPPDPAPTGSVPHPATGPRHARQTARRRAGRHARGRPRRLARPVPILSLVVAVVAVAGGAGAVTLAASPGSALASHQKIHHHAPTGLGATGMGHVADALASQTPAVLNLPAATAPPEPAPPSLADAPSLSAHEIFGYAPYWTLAKAAQFNVADLSTLAYFSLDVNADGTIAHSGSGWVGYQSQALTDLITRSHQAGDRVVLTASCFDQGALNELAANPQAGTKLGGELVALLEAKNLDGVNIDFEGKGPGDQAGLDRLMAQLSATVHLADRHWQVTMATYASSAGDPTGFYDIAGLAGSVDAFFVMAYDMNDPAAPSPTAGLSGGPGFTDDMAAQEYTALVPPTKVVLGVPYYGYDWPTAGPGLGDPATGGPTPLSYSVIAGAGNPVYWDPTSQTAWTSYQIGTQWHQTWFDNPTSLTLKADLASSYGLRGLGIWALGMDGNNPAMLGALLGHAPATKELGGGPGPTATTSSTTSSSTTTSVPSAPTYRGTWQGQLVGLRPVRSTDLPGTIGEPDGQLTGFTTDDPAATCLETAAELPVSPLVGDPGVEVVTASQPADCLSGIWEIVPLETSTTTTSSTTTTTTTTGSSSTTTTPDPTTTSTSVTTTPSQHQVQPGSSSRRARQ